MSLFEAKRNSGELKGLLIPKHKGLLYQLFVDDAGFFLHNLMEEFQPARAAIQTFKNIFGALLNVGKSVIVPLINPASQDWFAQIGCQVLQPNATTRYLGCLIGYNVTAAQETEFLLGKVRKRLNHWANRSLSFAGRTILLRHVIRAMPIYHLMAMSLNAQGFEDLECISRDFLWGKNEDGEFSKALVAWDDLAHMKAEGGIDFKDFGKLSLNLK